MKAVLWVDTLQAVIMLAGLLAILIRGSAKLGGLGKVWKRAGEYGRLQYWK